MQVIFELAFVIILLLLTIALAGTGITLFIEYVGRRYPVPSILGVSLAILILWVLAFVRR